MKKIMAAVGLAAVPMLGVLSFTAPHAHADRCSIYFPGSPLWHDCEHDNGVGAPPSMCPGPGAWYGTPHIRLVGCGPETTTPTRDPYEHDWGPGDRHGPVEPGRS
jgi:hypothetical protein